MSAKFVYHDLGSLWVLGIVAETPTQLQETFYSLWNHGATNGELQSLGCDKFGFIITTPEKVERAFERAEFMKLGDKKRAKTRAAQRLAAIEEEKFYPINRMGFEEVITGS
jgi:hypothetical protein